jgi:hypothetical protein
MAANSTNLNAGLRFPTGSVLIKITITVAVTILIIAQLVTRFELEAETVALVLVAILPWLSTIVESVELPGGGRLLFREVREVVAAQQEQLNAQQQVINQLVLYSMSHLIFQHLAGIYHANKTGGEYLFQGNLEAFSRDLRFLRDHGYFHHFGVGELRDKQNLASSLRLTPAGNFYVELREELERQQKAEKEKMAAKLS